MQISEKHAGRPLLQLRSLLFLALLAVFPWVGRAQSAGPATMVIHARRFAFSPGSITLKKGHPARLILISDDVLHGLVVTGLGIQAEMPQGKQTEVLVTPKTEVLVTPTQTGDFAGKCSVYCGSGHREMAFVIHVVD